MINITNIEIEIGTNTGKGLDHGFVVKVGEGQFEDGKEFTVLACLYYSALYIRTEYSHPDNRNAKLVAVVPLEPMLDKLADFASTFGPEFSVKEAG